MARELTGRKVFAITAGFFGVIIAVNVLLAVKAVQTFPGLEVANSYVASQVFDKELAAQKALGWTLAHGYENGQLTLEFRDRMGAPVKVEGLTTVLGRTTEAAEDMTPDFTYRGGIYSAPVVLRPGKWMILLEARSADGVRFHQRLDLVVKG
jgi:nitrogen fixation protein FixH